MDSQTQTMETKPSFLPPMDCFNNESILNRISEEKDRKTKTAITELKKIAPDIPDDILLKLHQRSISLRQSNVHKHGALLENITAEMLTTANIQFREQVTIDKTGKIIGFNVKKDKKTYHLLDIVIGDSIDIGKSITDFVVLTCKTTCRERWTQDDWSLVPVSKPKKLILITISNDYPPSVRFGESSSRKIITCKPKNKDDRQFKLKFEDLINEL